MNINKLRNAYRRVLTSYYFISFPKSGRTWSKSFLSNYYACYLDLPLFYDFAPMWRRGKRAGVPRIIFTHAAHRDESTAAVRHSMQRITGKRVILQVRNPRHTAFTYYYRLVKRMQDKQAQSMSLAEFIRHPYFGLPRIIQFLNDWYESRESFDALIIVKYEHCVTRPHEEYARLLRFLSTEVDEACIQHALQCSVDTTRKIEEGGLIRDESLERDIDKGSQYFEATDASNLAVHRYAGDDNAYGAAFNAEDRVFMDTEIEKLHPDFGYSRGNS